jgi:hypothetical protein
MNPHVECRPPGHPEGEVGLAYLDRNNLYGEAMSYKMPEGEPVFLRSGLDERLPTFHELQEATSHNDMFEFGEDLAKAFKDKVPWFDTDMGEVTKSIMEIPEDGDYGYLFEVDLEYPRELHDLHNDYPFCPESKLPPDPSPFTRQSFREAGHDRFATKKLILDLNDKTEYVIHYRYLQLAIKHGLRVKRLHRVLRFKQSYWLRDYVNFNTEKRRGAKNSIEKEFYKLMTNSVFGKMLENVRDQRDIAFIFPDQKWNAIKFASHPIYKAHRVIVPGRLMAMEKARTCVKMNKPILVGQAILDISKMIMARFHYETMLPYFGPERLRLMYTDTDSLVYAIQAGTRTVAEDLLQLHLTHNVFDLSEMDDDTEFMEMGRAISESDEAYKKWKTRNEKALGFMKDEMHGIPSDAFTALRSKMYSVKLARPMMQRHHNPKKAAAGKVKPKCEHTKHKGIPDKVELTYQQYVDTYRDVRGIEKVRGIVVNDVELND